MTAEIKLHDRSPREARPRGATAAVAVLGAVAARKVQHADLEWGNQGRMVFHHAETTIHAFCADADDVVFRKNHALGRNHLQLHLGKSS